MKMKDYKVYQKAYNRLHQHRDLVEKFEYTINESPEEIIQYVLRYFTMETLQLSYPGKSFAVAIIYAKLIEQHFGTPFIQSLSDPDLLAGNDLYFVPYGNAQSLYDSILEKIPDLQINTNFYQVRRTVECFQLEFGLVKESTLL